MAVNGGQLTHYETAGNPGYTDAGAYAGSHSVLSSGMMGPMAAWEDAIYHRLSLLQPRLTTTWFDVSQGFSCMGSLGTSDDPSVRTADAAAYPWPANNATGVATKFISHESPDPYSMAPGVTQLGKLLSISINGPWTAQQQSTLSDASLVADGAAPTPVTAVDSTNSGYMYGGAAIFPRQALEAGTWYTAHAAGTATGPSQDQSNSTVQLTRPFDVTWRFQTAQDDPQTHAQMNTAGQVLLATKSLARVHVTVTLTGAQTPSAQRDMTDGQTWSSGVAGGTYNVCIHQDPAGSYAGHDGCETAKTSARRRPSPLPSPSPGVRTVGTRLRVTSRVKRGLLHVTATVSSRVPRTVTYAVSVGRRSCRAGRGCRVRYTAYRTVNANAGASSRIRLPRSARAARVRVTVPAATIGQTRYLSASTAFYVR